MTPTPKRANSKKKIRVSFSRGQRDYSTRSACTKARSEFVWKARVPIALLSRFSLALARCPKTTARPRAHAQRDSSQAFLKVYKSVSKADICTTDETDDALGRGYKGIRSMRGARSSEMAATSSRDESVCMLSRVFCARASF